MSTMEQDLRERWLPSPRQMELADAVLAEGLPETDWDSGAYTIHLLVNKQYGWWGEGIEIIHIEEIEGVPAVFLTRSGALTMLEGLAKAHHEKTGQKLVGGYAWHSKPGHAAVWDDICSEFPKQ